MVWGNVNFFTGEYYKNWGNSYQYGVIPTSYPSFSEMPFWSVMPSWSAMPWSVMPSIPTFSPWSPMTAGGNSAAAAGANAFDTAYAKQIHSTLIQSVQGFITKLEQIVKSDQLKGVHKAKIQGLIDEARAFERTLKNVSNITRETAENMQKEFDKLCRKYEDTSAEIQEDLKKSADASTSSSSSSSSSSTSADDEKIGLNDDGSVTIKVDGKDINVDPKTGKVAGSTNPSNAECREFASTLFNAIDGCGTDNDAVAQAISGITKDNVVEIMQMFNKMYNTSGDSMETLMVRLMNDLGHGQKKEYVPVILNALLERAEALGIGDDATILAEMGKINDELSDCSIDEDVVGKGLDRIAKVIADKEKSNITAAESKIKESKTKAEKDEAGEKAKLKTENKEKVEELKAEFARDMKQDLGLDRVPALSGNVTVKTDENGAFECFVVKVEGVKYKGYSYGNLAAKLEDYGYKAKDVLARRRTEMVA